MGYLFFFFFPFYALEEKVELVVWSSFRCRNPLKDADLICMILVYFLVFSIGLYIGIVWSNYTCLLTEMIV